VDATFFSFNFVKVLSGGWIPLVTGSFILFIMQTWKWGTRRISKFMSEGSIPLEALLEDLSAHPDAIGRIPGTAVFMTGNPANRLSVLLHHLKHNHVLHERVILLSVVTESVPYIEVPQRLSMSGRGQGFYEVKAVYGYMQSPDIHEIVEYLNAQGFQLDVNSISYFVGRVSLRVEEKRRGFPIVARLMRFMHRNSEPATDWFKLPPGRVVELGTQIPI
jgi:KUP system potassium uptake protein